MRLIVSCGEKKEAKTKRKICSTVNEMSHSLVLRQQPFLLLLSTTHAENTAEDETTTHFSNSSLWLDHGNYDTRLSY